MRFSSVLLLILCAGVAALAPAQDNSLAPIFPKPAYFKTVFSNPSTKVDLEPPSRLADFVVNGKLELSLKGYLDLVMANNTDILVQRLSIQPLNNAITRGWAIYDPNILASFGSTRTKQQATDALTGASVLNQLSQPFNFSYTQLLQSGTTINAGFANTKTSTNSSFATVNPAHSSNMNVRVTQPLLRNRGGYVNRLPIIIAKSRLKAGEFSLQDQVLRLVVTAENAYWDVIFARENLSVQEQALALADQLLKRSKRELELGAISELDIYQPEANRATAEIAVTQARFRLAQTEDALRKQVGADLDPSIRNLPVALTETVDINTAQRAIDREEAVQKALQFRQDLLAQRETLAGDDLAIRSARNALLPDLSLSGQYQSSGRGGTFYNRTNVFQNDGTSSVVTNIIPGGFGDALDQVFGFGYPVYGVSLTLRLPVRDRNAAANYADAVVSKRLDTLRARSLEQQIRLDVLNAISQLEQSRASVDLAKVALDLAQKRADAEQKKYDLGTTTIYFVAAAQQDLTTARSTLVTNMVSYKRNLMTLLQRTGELLNERNIVVQPLK